MINWLIDVGQVWSAEDLKLVDQVDINRGGILTILVDGMVLYAGTSAGSIVVWDLDKNAMAKELKNHDSGVMVLRMFKGLVYSGDCEGKVLSYGPGYLTRHHLFLGDPST